MVQRRKLGDRQRDVTLERLSILIHGVEAVTDLPALNQDFGSVRYVDARLNFTIEDGLPETEQTTYIDLDFQNRFIDWVGGIPETEPIEPAAVTLRRAELELEDPSLPADLRERLRAAYDGYMKLEADHAEFFRTVAVLAPEDKVFAYF